LLRTAALVTRPRRRVAARRCLASVSAFASLTSFTALATVAVAVITRWTARGRGLFPAGRLRRPWTAPVTFWGAITVVAIPIFPRRSCGLAGTLFPVTGRPAWRAWPAVVEVTVPRALTAHRTVVLGF
jgi:hypothetical protein